MWAALLSLAPSNLQPCLQRLLDWLSQWFAQLDSSQLLLALQMVHQCAKEVRTRTCRPMNFSGTIPAVVVLMLGMLQAG